MDELIQNDTDENPPRKSLTQSEVEAFIMLAGQRKERWFKLVFIDEDMNKDPTATALMTSIADVIHNGIIEAAFIEQMEQAEEDAKGVSRGTH